LFHTQTLFRHCPLCGRKFEVRIVARRPASESRPKGAGQSIDFHHIGPVRTPVSMESPTVVSLEEFEYSYRCKHCGHEWTEIR